jgi:hypothetical protein
LEAEFGDLSGQTLRFDLGRPAIKVVGAEVLVFGAVPQHVVDCGEHRSSDGADRSLRAEPRTEAVVLRLVVAPVLASGGLAALNQQRLQPGGAFSQARRLALAGTFILPRAHAGPRQEMTGGRKATISVPISARMVFAAKSLIPGMVHKSAIREQKVT